MMLRRNLPNLRCFLSKPRLCFSARYASKTKAQKERSEKELRRLIRRRKVSKNIELATVSEYLLRVERPKALLYLPFTMQYQPVYMIKTKVAFLEGAGLYPATQNNLKIKRL